MSLQIGFLFFLIGLVLYLYSRLTLDYARASFDFELYKERAEAENPELKKRGSHTDVESYLLDTYLNHSFKARLALAAAKLSDLLIGFGIGWMTYSLLRSVF